MHFSGGYRTADDVIPELLKETKNWKPFYFGVSIYADTVRFKFTNDYPAALEQ